MDMYVFQIAYQKMDVMTAVLSLVDMTILAPVNVSTKLAIDITRCFFGFRPTH